MILQGIESMATRTIRNTLSRLGSIYVVRIFWSISVLVHFTPSIVLWSLHSSMVPEAHVRARYGTIALHALSILISPICCRINMDKARSCRSGLLCRVYSMSRYLIWSGHDQVKQFRLGPTTQAACDRDATPHTYYMHA
jgi:hypothetical protein